MTAQTPGCGSNSEARKRAGRTVGEELLHEIFAATEAEAPDHWTHHDPGVREIIARETAALTAENEALRARLDHLADQHEQVMDDNAPERESGRRLVRALRALQEATPCEHDRQGPRVGGFGGVKSGQFADWLAAREAAAEKRGAERVASETAALTAENAELRAALDEATCVECTPCPGVPEPVDAGAREALAEVVIDAIEETFLGQLPSKALSYCAQEDINAGLDALRERFGLEVGR